MTKIFQKLIALHVEASNEPISNLPYIICNEQRQQETLAHLTPLPKNDKSTLHLGFSVWFNLDIICTTRPYYAAIFDIDPEVHQFVYPLLKSLILNSATREEFIAQFLVAINENENIAPYSTYLEAQFQQLQSTTHGFLATQKNFNYLKEMITEGRVFFGKADLTKKADISLIEQWISDNELDLKTLYLSNIPEWINQQSKSTWETAQLNISKLIQPDVQLIDAFYPTTKKDGSGPPQRVTQGEFPDYTVQRAPKTIHHYSPQKDRMALFSERAKAQGSESSDARATTAKRKLGELFAEQTNAHPDTQKCSVQQDVSVLLAEQAQTAASEDSEAQVSAAQQDLSDSREKPAKIQRTKGSDAQISTAKRDFSALLAAEPTQTQKEKRKIPTSLFFTPQQATDHAQDALANSVSESAL